MIGRFLIVPILVFALFTFAVAPPVQAELVTLTVILAAAFLSTALVVETARNRDDDQVAKVTEQDAAL